MRKFLIVSLSVVAMLAAYHYGKRWYFGPLWATSFCDRIELASVDSPDLRWQAKAIQFGCGSALFGSDDFVAVVVVRRGSWWITKRDEVLQGDSKWECGGKFEWRSNDLLLVSLPENFIVDRETMPAANVAVKIAKVPVSDAINPATCDPV
jgi:hypothetical protein